MLFHARTPMLSPAVVYGLLGCLWIGLRHGRDVLTSPVLLFSVALLLFPLAALNQQIVSGIMIQTLNWERYVNIPFVLIGLTNALRVSGRADSLTRKLQSAVEVQWHRLVQVLTSLMARPGMQRVSAISDRVQRLWLARKAMVPVVIPALLVLALLFVGQAQRRGYQQFLHYNVLTQGYAQAADRALLQDNNRGSQIILDNMNFDAPIRVRSQQIQDQLAGYSWIVTTAMAKLLRDPQSTELPMQGYQIAARLGLSADAYRDRLQRELDGAYCWPHLMYLAPFLECAPYVSDFRRYDPANLQAIADRSVADYAAYLSDRQRQQDTPALILSSTPLDFSDADLPWKTELLFETETALDSGTFLPAASATIYAYRQTSGGSAGN